MPVKRVRFIHFEVAADGPQSQRSYRQLGITVGILTALLLFVADRFPDPVREEKKEESVADAGKESARRRP
jgi:hypothetical protein